jgi:hypothetical protein
MKADLRLLGRRGGSARRINSGSAKRSHSLRFSGHLSTPERAGESLKWLLSLLINYDEILVFGVGDKDC